MWTLSVSFLLKVELHWSHLNVLSPVANTGTIVKKKKKKIFKAISHFLVYCCVCKNTVITHSKRGTQFEQADCAQSATKTGVSLHQTTPHKGLYNSLVQFSLNRACPYIVRVQSSGEALKQTALPYVCLSVQNVPRKTSVVYFINHATERH